MAGYAILGAIWLLSKLDGESLLHLRTLWKRSAWATFVLMGGASHCDLLLNNDYTERWLSAPEIYFPAPCP